MNYSEIYEEDTLNGPGFRVSLFVSGCNHRCKGCWNPSTWDFDAGKPYTQETEDYIIECLNAPMNRGLSLLGGEPMEHVEPLLKLLKRFKMKYPNKEVWVWSGYKYEYLIEQEKYSEILQYIDVLVDGRFVQELRDLNLFFRGSSNQRIIKVPESLLEGKVILHELNK